VYVPGRSIGIEVVRLLGGNSSGAPLAPGDFESRTSGCGSAGGLLGEPAGESNVRSGWLGDEGEEPEIAGVGPEMIGAPAEGIAVIGPSVGPGETIVMPGLGKFAVEG